MIQFFVRHPTAANLLMIILLAAGLLSARKLRRETFPDFRPKEVEIRIPYPGAMAEEVAETICQRVEDALDGVRFIEELRCDARENLAVATAEMKERGDIRTFKDEIETQIAAIDDFPPEVETPIISELHTTEPVLSLLVSGPMPPPDLKAYCEDLKDRLRRLPEIALVRIQGFSDHQLRIELDGDALRRFGISAAQVAQLVASQNVNLPAGAIETRQAEITVRFVEERRTTRDIEDLVVVAGLGGAEIRLGDIATVSDVFELDEDKVLLDNRRAGLLQIEMTKNQDAIRVAAAVKTFVREELARRPRVDIRVTQDLSSLISDRLNMLQKNAVQGMLLVFLCMWLFFSFKLSFWVVMSLPVSFIGAFFFLPQLDLTINMLTMVGLLLAVGLLMDDGIVIAENIAAHAARGDTGIQAAIHGVTEVQGGVLASFFTTVCVLGPLAFLDGKIGRVLEVVPMILLLVMSVSLIEAFMILPAHLAHSLRPSHEQEPRGFRRRFDAGIDWVRQRVVGRSVDVLLRWRYLFIGVVMFLFLVSVGMLAGGVLKFQAFPELDGDTVEARLLLPKGTPLPRTEEIVRLITDGLDQVNHEFAPQQPGNQDLVETVYVLFNQNIDAFDSGTHVATVVADLLTAEVRNTTLDELFQAWRNAVGRPADAVDLTYSEPSLTPAGRNIEIRLSGKRLDELPEAMSELRHWMAQFPGVLNLVDDLRPGKQEVHLRLREGVLGLGLDARTAAVQLRAAFYGLTADEIQVGPESYEIDVRLRREDQNGLADLDYFQFTLPGGKQIPLATAAVVEGSRGWARLARVNGMPTVTLRGDVNTRQTNTQQLMGQLRTDFLPEFQRRHPEVTLSLQGEIKEAQTTQASMRRAMLIGLLGVFVLLSFQFRSYVEPLIVMAAIPLALIGVIWGHLIMRIDLCLPSVLGFISLAGIVVNDSILLVLFLKNRRRQGADIMQAAAQASRLRFRAVVITSLTTVAGLLPLLAERSLQAQVLIPLAISIAFGLMTSTFLVLLVIPCLYAILGDLGLATKATEDPSGIDTTQGAETNPPNG